MPCFHPLNGYRSRRLNSSGKRSIVFTPNQGYVDQKVQVPCGQCIGCRLERSRQWGIRGFHESKLYEDNCFLTLTYSPENIPPNGTLVKKHFQDFMKRYRKWTPRKIRFIHCGEYGENFGRPHYHAVIFNHDFHDKYQWTKSPSGEMLYRSDSLEALWTHGFSSIGTVTFESIAYVARYVTKKITGPKAEEHYGYDINYETGEYTQRRIPEYTTMSRRPGIGKPWLDKYHKDVFPSDEVILRGKQLKPPKFYTAQYEKLDLSGFENLKRRRIADAKENAENNTYERLMTREEIQLNKFQQLKRTLK